MKTKHYILIAITVVVALGIYLARTETFTSAPSAAEPPIVELKDSDSYTLVMEKTEKDIGGTTHSMLAYNGSIPGPTIKVPQGAEITITLKNGTDIKTLLHSHGIRMDNPFDGSQTTQKDMEPGETFSYKLKFPDAGVFWYHPHVADYYAQEMGLYGAFVVEPRDKKYWPLVHRETVLFLDDILIKDDDTIAVDTEHAHRALMGTYGNVMLTNGETNYALSAKKGEVIRFYIINAANTRPFNFAIDGARMKLVGGDNGAYERDEWRESVLLSPSERAVVDVLFESAGAFALQNKTPNKTYALGAVTVSDETIEPSYAKDFATLTTHAATIASVEPFRTGFAASPDKRIALTVDMMGGITDHGGHMMPNMTATGADENGIEWEDATGRMNAMSDADMVRWHIVDQDTGKKDMDIDWNFKAGDTVKIRVFNDSKSAHPMQHPLHFHGQRFLVLEENGKKNMNLVWKDTVLVPAGATIDILLDASNPGIWMAHCHILEHIEAGMMLAYKVVSGEGS